MEPRQAYALEDTDPEFEGRISQVIPDHGNTTDESYSDADESEYNTDAEEAAKAPMRVRKKSVMPFRAMDLDTLELPEQSPGNSITSVNSIASLLKEKLSMMALPGLMKAKRRQSNYKLKGFVAMLFLIIVFLVVFAYVFYHQQVLQRAYFEKIRFNKDEKVVRVFDDRSNVLLSGILGTTLSSDLVFNCLRENTYTDGSVCMEWMHKARLYLRYREPSNGVRCYQITWMSLDQNINPTDCFDWSGDGHWYGGGQAKNMTWPAELGVVKWSPFVTGDVATQQWGNVLQRYFLNSKGVAISIDQATPLYVSIDTGKEGKQFCIQARHDDFAYYYRTSLLPQLNYSICVSHDIKILHNFLSEKSLWDGLKADDISTVNLLLTEPVWQIVPERFSFLTEAAVYNYTDELIKFPFLAHGHILLNEMWQRHIGDFTMDEERFPTMADTMQTLRRRGFRFVFTIQPFISTESPNFREAVRERLLVTERGSGSIPALTRYKGVDSAGILDITNNRSIPWLQQKLKVFVDKYWDKQDINNISFYLDLGSAYNMPHFYNFDRTLVNIDEYKTLFTEAVQQHVNVIGVSSAVKRPRAPVFVSMPPLSSTWASLTEIIPTVLTYGIIGYPFIMPGPVGGDFVSEESLYNYTHIYLKRIENIVFQKQLKTWQKPDIVTTPPPVVAQTTSAPIETMENERKNDTEDNEPVIEQVINQAVKVTKIFDNNLNKSEITNILETLSNSDKKILEEGKDEYPGDLMISDQANELNFLPDQELYQRWLQIAIFLPVIRFTYLPSHYKDKAVSAMAQYLTELRRNVVNPQLQKYRQEALDHGLPIIRPLWMLDPADSTCHTVVDEFSIGDGLIVAPIIHEATTEREVYLPAGVWKDGIDGSLRKGSRWIHKYRVPQNKVAFFIKMPGNTRF